MDKSRVEPSIFFIEKIKFSLKLCSAHFYGQSFIKTVRGPLSTHVFAIIIKSQEKIKLVKWSFLNFNLNGQNFAECKNQDFM